MLFAISCTAMRSKDSDVSFFPFGQLVKKEKNLSVLNTVNLDSGIYLFQIIFENGFEEYINMIKK